MMGTRALAASTPWNGWSHFWATWFLVSFFVFLGAELYAIASGHPENTLSAQVWRIEGFAPGHDPVIWQWTALHILVGGILAVVLLWLVGHFVFGLWT